MKRFFRFRCLAFAALALLALAPRAGAAPAQAATSHSLTFFMISDLHYNWPAEGNYTLQRAAIKAMNELPGTPYPKAIGGAVAAPRGVVALGDLVESNKTPAYAAWEADFGLKGEKLLHYPVYELLGNHDNTVNTVGWEGIKRRNPLRADLAAISPNGYHYAFDWNGIHFVALNICASNGPDPSLKYKLDPHASLDFLKDDLKKNVGKSGRPVIVLQHFDLYNRAWFSQAQVDALGAALAPYNVILLAHGHSHSTKKYTAGYFDVLDDGSLKNGEQKPGISSFYVIRIEGNRLIAQQRHVDGQWGKVVLDKTFSWKQAGKAPQLTTKVSVPSPAKQTAGAAGKKGKGKRGKGKKAPAAIPVAAAQ